MNKKSLLIIIMAVTVALLVAFGTIFLFLKKVDEKEEEPEIIEEVDLNKIDYEQLVSYTLEDMTIKIVQTASKPHYLMLQAGIYVTDEEGKNMYLNPKYIVGYFPIEDDKTLGRIVTSDTLKGYEEQRVQEAQAYINMGAKAVEYPPQEKD